MSGNKLWSGALPTDKVVAIYILITAFLLFFIPDKSIGITGKLTVKIFILTGIVVLIAVDLRHGSRFTHFLHLFYPLLLLGYAYGETALLNHIFFSKNLDPFFINLDDRIFGFQPALEFSWSFPQKWFGELMNLGYFSYYFMTVGISLIIYLYNGQYAEKAIFIIITSFFIYYLIFIIFPVVGPQFYFEPPLSDVPETGFFGNAVKAVQEAGEHPTGAFPSSHVGMALIFLWLGFKTSKTLFRILLPFVILILFATVYIKAHYAVDVIGGIMSAPVILFLSNKIRNLFSI